MSVAIVLEARNLNKSFGAVTAAADINVRVEQDSVVGLIGSNGAGKTTFINMVTGYLTPSSGSIHYLDRDITGLSPREITQLGICRSFQIPQLFNTLTVHENLQVGVGIAARSRARSRRQRARREQQQVETLIERFNLAGYRGQAAGLLPEGVRKLLDIAMAVAGRPSAAAARRADQRRVGGREVPAHGHGDGGAQGAGRHGAVRRARHGDREPLHASRAGFLRGPHHRRRRARARCSRTPKCAAT